MKNFKITKREVLASISIVAIMLLIGFLISGKISEYQMDNNEKYNKAVKIEDKDLFEYGMRTDIGNAFAYGDLLAIDTVTYPEIGNAYMYIEKVEEHYTEHTKKVEHTRTVNGETETYYTEETCWTWDYKGRESLTCKEVSFLGVVFDAKKISFPSEQYIDTIKVSSRVRYKYYGVATKFTGTIFTELRKGTIMDDTTFYEDKTIEETMDYLESSISLVIFWILWLILIAVCLFGFFYIDNRGLE